MESEKGKAETESGKKSPANRDNNRDERGRFVKGNRANPSGRPTLPTDAKNTLVSMLPKALDTLREIIDDPKVKPDTRLRATEIVIERNLGKAVTPIITETVGTGSTLTLAEMIACAKELLDSD